MAIDHNDWSRVAHAYLSEVGGRTNGRAASGLTGWFDVTTVTSVGEFASSETWRLWRWIATAAMVFGLLFWPEPVAASNWYGATGYVGCNNGNMQDNGDMTYHRSGLTTAMYNATAYALNNAAAPTDIDVLPEQAVPDGNTDVVYYDADYSTYCNKDWHPDDPADPDSSSIVGLAECKSLSGSRCQRFESRYDTSYTPSLSLTQQRGLACHETGHALGLKHTTDATSPTCIRTYSINTYSPHEISTHLNPNY